MIGVPNRDMGEEVKALVVPADPADPPTGEELIAWCRERLAGYKCPRSVDIVETRRPHADGQGQQARAAPAVLGDRPAGPERTVDVRTAGGSSRWPPGRCSTSIRPAAVDAAAGAGFGAAGIWFDPATWTPATTAAVATGWAPPGSWRSTSSR